MDSAPPTPPPGGTLQLPPDAPGSFWGSSVATGPVAEGVTEGSSTATPSTLEQLMSREGVPDNDTLVVALNAAAPEEQSPWIKAAIQWFATQPIETLSPAAIRDYAALAHVRSMRENKDLLKNYFDSLCNKVKGEYHGEKPLIQALAYALAHIERDIFKEDPQPLIALGKNLLAKLDPNQREFKQADYPSAHASLEALSQTLFLVRKIAPGHLNVRDHSLYQNFRRQLQAIADRSQYYPVCYQARLLKQTLRLLEDSSPNLDSKLKRIGQGLLGAANLVVVGQGLATGELKLAEFQEGIALLKRAFERQRIEPEAWYSKLLSLEEAMLCCFDGRDLRFYPEPAVLVQRAKDISAQCGKLEQVAAAFGADKIKQYKQALRFGIVMQLRTLSLCGPTPEIRQGSIERLIALAQPVYWGSKTGVMAGLLDSLALVAVQSQAERASEAAMAKAALEALKTEISATQWLAGEELDIKLQRLGEQANQYMPSCEERLFSQVKAMLQPVPAPLVRQVQEGLDKVLEAIQNQNENQPPSNSERDQQALRALSQQVERMLSEVQDVLQGAKASLTPQQLHEGLDQVLQDVEVPKEATPSAAILQYSQKVEQLLSGLKGAIQSSHPSLTSQQFQDGIEKLIQAIQGQRPAYGPKGSSLTRQSSLGWLREQIALGRSPDAVYPLIATRLRNSEKGFTRSDQISLLVDCVRYGRINAEKISEKDAVIVLGNTGAGKSTFINYIAGCQLEKKRVKGCGRVLVVKDQDSGGVLDEVTPIGHGKQSKTFMPHIVAVDKQVYCDCPGFSDNRGVEINIANAVNIKQALSRAASIRIIVLVNYESLSADRGNSFQDLLRTLIDLLGGEASIAKHKQSILLGISKYPDPTTREELWEDCLSGHVPDPLSFLKECLFVFNPLTPEEGWDRAGCLAALDKLNKLADPSSILSVSLTNNDLYVLHELVDAMGEEIVATLAWDEVDEAVSLFQHLQWLSVIEHEKIEKLFSSTRNRVSSWLKEQEANFHLQCAMRDFPGAESLLSSLSKVASSFGCSDLDLSSLQKKLDSTLKNSRNNQKHMEGVQKQVSLLYEQLVENASRAESNHRAMLDFLKEHKEKTSEQLKKQEEVFQNQINSLEQRLRDQEKAQRESLLGLQEAHELELSRKEAEIQQKKLSLEEREQEVSALRSELKRSYEDELKTQKQQHDIDRVQLQKEIDKESVLHRETQKRLVEREKLLSVYKQEYEKLLEKLQESELQHAQEENQDLQ